MKSLNEAETRIGLWIRDQLIRIAGEGGYIGFVWEKYNAARPKLPYVSAMITSTNDVGQPDVTDPDEKGIATILHPVYVNLTISAYNKQDASYNNAKEILSKLRYSVNREDVKEYFEKNELGYLPQPLTIREIGSVVGSGFEERAIMEMTFNIVLEQEDETAGVIETVEVEQKIEV